MDESLFFFEDFNTHSTSAPTANDRTMLTGVLVGLFLGLTVHLLYICSDRTRRKMEELMDEIDTLKETVEELVEENEDMSFENDKLTADASASERLIERLKDEVTDLTNKLNTNQSEITDLESDNYALAAELSHRLNNGLRIRQTPPNRTNTSPVALPVIRKRAREEL